MESIEVFSILNQDVDVISLENSIKALLVTLGLIVLANEHQWSLASQIGAVYVNRCDVKNQILEPTDFFFVENFQGAQSKQLFLLLHSIAKHVVMNYENCGIQTEDFYLRGF